MTYPVALAALVGAGMASPVDLRTRWSIADVLDGLDSIAWLRWRERENQPKK